jgi:hypothetical protein
VGHFRGGWARLLQTGHCPWQIPSPVPQEPKKSRQFLPPLIKKGTGQSEPTVTLQVGRFGGPRDIGLSESQL